MPTIYYVPFDNQQNALDRSAELMGDTTGKITKYKHEVIDLSVYGGEGWGMIVPDDFEGEDGETVEDLENDFLDEED